jgi:hypothetical protein
LAALSFPKIISARSDDAALTERVWRQRFGIAGLIDQWSRPHPAGRDVAMFFLQLN